VSTTALEPDAAGPVTIRPMRWWDLDAVLPLERQLFADDPWSAAAFWGELARPESRHCVVAEDEQGLVGYAVLMTSGGDADVQTIAVAPRARGTGLGRRLLTDLLMEAARRGAGDVLLEVRADNDPALQLYTSTGFERIAVRRGYYASGGDAVVMRLREVARRYGDDGVPAGPEAVDPSADTTKEAG
jgi:ribosomal-protein-alanine N-acetyltransferase